MPTYEYVCEDGHVTERRGRLDEDEITCLADVTYEYMEGIELEDPCLLPARRRPAYLSQGVIFPGTGFTRTIIPPAKPQPPSTAKENTEIAFEQLDEYAEKQYRDQENYEPEREKLLSQAAEVAERGGIL